MLFFAIGLCAALLVLANLAATYSKRPRLLIGLLCLMILIASPFVSGKFLPTVLYFVGFLLVTLLDWGMIDSGSPASFRKTSILALFLAFGLSGFQVWQTEAEYARLRQKYPLISLEARLPAPRNAALVSPLSAGAIARVEMSEEGGYERYEGSVRARRLGRLHEDSVLSFIESFGLGVGRMLPRELTEWNLAIPDTEKFLREPDGEASDRRQPGPTGVPAGSPGDWTLLAPEKKSPLGFLLNQAFAEFADPRTFSYFRDRPHVAGFMPHQVRHVPKLSEDWTVRTLDLVGLLLHDGPIVYVSADLPRMDELRHVPTRTLDRFEVVGLESLRGGEDLMVAQDGEITRMIGGIRSTKYCISCHGGQRGDLLGAFSYTLSQAEPDLSPIEADVR